MTKNILIFLFYSYLIFKSFLYLLVMRGSDTHVFKGNLATSVVLRCVLEALKPRVHAHTGTGQLLSRIIGHLVMYISQNSTLRNKAVGYWYVCLAACPAHLSQNIGALSSGAVRVCVCARCVWVMWLWASSWICHAICLSICLPVRLLSLLQRCLLLLFDCYQTSVLSEGVCVHVICQCLSPGSDI